MTAEFAGDAAKMKIASIDKLCLRLVINGAEVTVDAREADPFHSTADQVTDYAVSELRKLRDRLNDFGDAVLDHKENGGFPADFPLMREVESFCLDHIRLTRRYWSTTYKVCCLSSEQSRPINVWRKDELSRVAFARAARMRVHLRLAKSRLCPPIQSTIAEPVVAEQCGLQSTRVEGRSIVSGLLKTPIEHVLRLLVPRPKTLHT